MGHSRERDVKFKGRERRGRERVGPLKGKEGRKSFWVEIWGTSKGERERPIF